MTPVQVAIDCPVEQTTRRRTRALSEPSSRPRRQRVRERNHHALRRQNLRSSGAGAVAGAIVVGLLAAIDPAIPLAGVGMRTASAFVVGAAVGLTLSSLSNSLHRSRTREFG